MIQELVLLLDVREWIVVGFDLFGASGFEVRRAPSRNGSAPTTPLKPFEAADKDVSALFGPGSRLTRNKSRGLRHHKPVGFQDAKNSWGVDQTRFCRRPFSFRKEPREDRPGPPGRAAILLTEGVQRRP